MPGCGQNHIAKSILHHCGLFVKPNSCNRICRPGRAPAFGRLMTNGARARPGLRSNGGSTPSPSPNPKSCRPRATGDEPRAIGAEPRAMSHGRQAASRESRPPVPESRFPNPDSRFPAVGPSNGVRSPRRPANQETTLASLARCPAVNSGFSTLHFRISRSQLLSPPWFTKTGVPRYRTRGRLVAYSVSFDSGKGYPQRRMAIRPCHKPSNSGQNRSKRRRFPSKRDQKGAHFVMPILTFGGVTPSGASARADFALPKGKKGAFSGRSGASSKVIHNYVVVLHHAARPGKGSARSGRPRPHPARGRGEFIMGGARPRRYLPAGSKQRPGL